jgi:multidrug efflux pump subunit AcrA (membrane-fusion protein)
MARTLARLDGPRRPHRRWRRAVPWALGIVVVAGGTAVGVGLSAGGGPRYRLARVTTGSPTAELAAIGTIVPVDQASVTFGVSGTVASVAVASGDRVTAGQTLATLVSAPLQAAVDRAQSELASAQATLATAEASETGPTTAATGQSSSAASNVGSAQATVVADQHALDGAEHVAEVDLTAADQACAATSSSGPSTGTAGPVPGTAGPRSAPSSQPSSGGVSQPSSGTTVTGAPTAACSGALGQLSHDQAAVSSDTAALETDEAVLAGALSSSPTVTAANGSGGAASRSGSTAPAGGASTTGPSVGTAPASPQQLASDQAAVDVASAQLASAQRALGDATLTTPLSGTVAAVGLSPGQAVSSGVSTRGATSASTASVVVVAPGADEVDLALPVSDLPELAVGQRATVVPDSTGEPIRGTVSTIGLVATTSSTGVTSYPVTVTVAAGSGLPLRTGGQASVAIVVGHATDVTVVPTSAVHRIGALRTVDVDEAGTAAAVRVTTGVVGARWTQVTAGLRRGEQVVVADLAAPLPTSTTGPGALRVLVGAGFSRPRSVGTVRARAGGG